MPAGTSVPLFQKGNRNAADTADRCLKTALMGDSWTGGGPVESLHRICQTDADPEGSWMIGETRVQVDKRQCKGAR